MSLDQLHPERWTFLWSALSTLSIKLCAALALLVAGWWLSRRVGNWLNRLLTNKERVDDTLRPILCDVAAWGIRIVAMVGALSQLGIETASIVAVLGAAGLAIGLALQGTMQNIAAGIMLLLLRPFKVGEYIDGSAGIAGTVDEVGLFMTRLTKPDGICEYVPNSALWGSAIRNYTRNPTRRLDLEVEVSVHDDIDRALEALRGLALADPDVLQEPEPTVMVMRFDDSTAIANMRVWTHTEKFWDMRWRLARQARKALADANCTLPIRTRELHIVHDAARRTEGERVAQN
ncbi:mechanosensitive ion channel protein MscS [Burkholderia territorii]|uniref:Small-conductance mechanosensitive channel n=1 Tax=Burkholderia territorii TaxID=1503055 RepID=A0A106DSL6_9BURK|nr:mechanosensitive ion channel family protein [Burkholderia territorii]KVV44239.1 mechanosensitive ion channel protein MscS [Burkholderia territorii]KVX34588.1 mechanosensitive ion channel protein MscS [Burkholderia territorii]